MAGPGPPVLGHRESRRAPVRCPQRCQALMAARQTRLQLNPPYGCFPVRKWANCNMSAPAGETDGQEGEAGWGEGSHLAAAGRGPGAGEGGRMESIVLQQGETLSLRNPSGQPLRVVLEAPPAAQACLGGFVLLVKEKLGDHSSVSENVNHRHLR